MGTIITIPSGGGASTWTVSGARNNNSSLNRDMSSDGLMTNQTPLIVPFDCESVVISASSNNTDTWDAVVFKNDSNVASLSLTAESKKASNEITHSFSKGDEIRLRLLNAVGSVNMPRITATFKEA